MLIFLKNVFKKYPFNSSDANSKQCISKSISNIMNNKIEYNETQIFDAILTDDILTQKTKELLIEYSNDIDHHSVLLITFKELLMYVWKLIESNEHKNEIKSVMNSEITDAEHKCFTGRLTRLVNILNGYSPLVEIKISDNYQIANIITLVKNDLEIKEKYTVQKHKEIVIEELKMRGYEDDTINTWVDQIE